MAKRRTSTGGKPSVDEQYHVLIIQDSDGLVCSNMGPHPESRAEKICNGASINLNHEQYSAVVVKASKLGTYLKRSKKAEEKAS